MLLNELDLFDPWNLDEILDESDEQLLHGAALLDAAAQGEQND